MVPRNSGGKNGEETFGVPNTGIPFSLIRAPLTFLEPQSRFGDKPLKLQVVCPQNGTAVLKGLMGRWHPSVPWFPGFR